MHSTVATSVAKRDSREDVMGGHSRGRVGRILRTRCGYPEDLFGTNLRIVLGQYLGTK
jgi:hypothetical protein